MIIADTNIIASLRVPNDMDGLIDNDIYKAFPDVAMHLKEFV